MYFGEDSPEALERVEELLGWAGSYEGALFEACGFGDTAAAVRLVKRLGISLATPQMCDSRPFLPLGIAAARGHLETVRALVVGCGADVDSRGESCSDCRAPLHEAAAMGQYDMVRLLALELGADVHLTDSIGATAMYYAAESGNCDIIWLLASLGASVDAPAARNGTSAATVPPPPPLYVAAQHARLDVVRLLCRLGADVNAVGPNGQTALHAAAGAESSYPDSMYETIPLTSPHVVMALGSFGASVDATDDEGRTPLFAGTQALESEVLRVLVEELGADVSIKDHSGCIALNLFPSHIRETALMMDIEYYLQPVILYE